MPAYQDRAARRLYQRAYRARKTLEAATARHAARNDAPTFPADPVAKLAGWAKATLKVPPGHPAAGEPMTLTP